MEISLEYFELNGNSWILFLAENRFINLFCSSTRQEYCSSWNMHLLCINYICGIRTAWKNRFFIKQSFVSFLVFHFKTNNRHLLNPMHSFVHNFMEENKRKRSLKLDVCDVTRTISSEWKSEKTKVRWNCRGQQSTILLISANSSYKQHSNYLFSFWVYKEWFILSTRSSNLNLCLSWTITFARITTL